MKRLVFILAGIALMLPASAQVDSTPVAQSDTLMKKMHALLEEQYSTRLEVSIDDAQQYALRQNRSLQNASLDVKKAHAQRWQTIASMLPQADGTAAYTNMCGYEMDFMGRNMAMPPYIQHSVTASIALNGQMIVGALLNNIAIEMQDITRAQKEDALRSNVIQTYASVLVLRDVKSLLDSSLVNIQTLAQQTLRMVEVGAAEQTQYDQIAVKVNTLRNSIQSTDYNLRISMDMLKVLLNVDASTELVLLSNLDEFCSEEKVYGLLLESFNMNNNYSYQLIEQNLKLAKHNLTMAGLAYAPTLSLAYQYTAKKYFSDEATFNMQPPHTIAATVKIPLWSSGKRAAAVTEQRIAVEQAENTFSETTDNLLIQYKNLRYALVNAMETYLNEKDNRDVTNRVMAHTSNKYNWGAASALELTNASNDLISAQSSYVNAVLSLVKAEVELVVFLNNK